MLEAVSAAAGPEPRLAHLALGPVALRSRAPERLVPFYQDALGLDLMSRSDERLVFGAGGRALVEIVRAGDAAPPLSRAPGLFHLALLVPDRAALAARLAALHRAGLRLGASDHLVSEALYVDDPDGNGIEIYRDRAPADWPRAADGTIAMETLPLNLSSLLGQAPAGSAPAPAGTRMGHVHLKVSDLEEARRFWVDLMGLSIMARYPGALFVSADGYHHHVGLNVWRSAGAPPRPEGSMGLARFSMGVPSSELEALAGRLAGAGWPFTREGDTLTVADGSGNTVVVSADVAR